MNIDEELLNDFLEKFPIREGMASNPYIILFDAYTGMGKSTVAKLIAQYDHSVILNNDEIRNYLNDYEDKSNLRNVLQNYRLEELLKKHNNCILDSCFCHNYAKKLAYYQQLGVRYFIVRLECPEDLIKERLAKRQFGQDNFAQADYNDYLWMKNNVPRVPDELVDFTIDTSKDLVSQVEAFMAYIQKQQDLATGTFHNNML